MKINPDAGWLICFKLRGLPIFFIGAEDSNGTSLNDVL